MKFFSILFFTCLTSFSQEFEDKQSWLEENYATITAIEITGNYDSRFGNEAETNTQKGLAIGINSLHGVFLFEYISLSVGLGVDLNVNRTFWSIPILGDLRIYFNEHGSDNSPFVFLQMGKNIRIGNVFVEGRPVKIGTGMTLNEDEKVQYVLEIFKKFKEASFIDEKGYYEVTGFGASFGIKF